MAACDILLEAGRRTRAISGDFTAQGDEVHVAPRKVQESNGGAARCCANRRRGRRKRPNRTGQWPLRSTFCDIRSPSTSNSPVSRPLARNIKEKYPHDLAPSIRPQWGGMEMHPTAFSGGCRATHHSPRRTRGRSPAFYAARFTARNARTYTYHRPPSRHVPIHSRFRPRLNHAFPMVPVRCVLCFAARRR